MWLRGTTYCPVLHELEAGAEVGQADVAVHIQQNVVGLDVPEGSRREREKMRNHLPNQTTPIAHETDL